MLQGKNRNEVNGIVFNIQRYSVHDGPGIRTTVFLKGCPLRCTWCSNPESQEMAPQIMVRDAKCMLCGKCAEICPKNAIRYEKDRRIIDWKRCDQCLKCALGCSYQALVVSGKQMTVKEVASIVSEDELFYQNSGGGMTVSGGEPLFQPEFTLGLLSTCKEKGMHTVLDTCGRISWDVLSAALPYVDLLLFDIKHLDPIRHREETGAGIKQIQANLFKIAEKNKRIWLRVPLIGGYNDSDDNIEQVADLGKRIKTERISLLLYHELGSEKYRQIGKKYIFQAHEPDAERIEALTAIIRGKGVEVAVGD